jgi:hypothetical protein
MGDMHSLFRPNAVLVSSGKPVPLEFSDKRISKFLSAETAVPPMPGFTAPAPSITSTSTVLAGASHLVSNAAVSTGTQATANLMLQTMLHIQQTASVYCIGQPKANTTFSFSPGPNTMSLMSTKHFSDLRRQQTKIMREGAIKIIGLFFLVRRGRKTDALVQVSD